MKPGEPLLAAETRAGHGDQCTRGQRGTRGSGGVRGRSITAHHPWYGSGSFPTAVLPLF